MLTNKDLINRSDGNPLKKSIKLPTPKTPSFDPYPSTLEPLKCKGIYPLFCQKMQQPWERILI